MKQGITATFLFVLLAYTGELNLSIFAAKVDFWDQIGATKKNMTTFSLQCQHQMVKIESKIYHLDRLRSSLKSGYFEKLFTSDDFKQKNERVLEIQLKNGEVFPAIIDLIHGKKLPNILNKDNYLPLLVAMDQLEMEIDLENFGNFIDHNSASYSLQEAKIFDLYDFIRENSNFEYLLEKVFEIFADDLTTLQNHTIFLSLPIDYLTRIINKVEHLNDKKIYKIVQMCTEWLCHDMESRLFHMANLANSIKSAFHFSVKMNTSFSKFLQKCDVHKQTKRKIILRCLFALLANKKLNPERLDKLKPAKTLKLLSPLDAPILKLYNSAKNDSKSEYLLECVFKYFADNVTKLQNHRIFPYLPHSHLIRIIKKVQEPNDEKRYEIIQTCTEWLCHDMENRLPHLVNLVTSAKFLFHSSIERNTDVRKCLPKCHVDEQEKRKIILKCLFALLADGEQLNPEIFTDDESNYHSDDGFYSRDDARKSYNAKKYMKFVHRNDEYAKLKKFLNNSDFYDITVRVGEKTYKLHRIILELKCGYFRDYFRFEYAEAVAQCHGIPTCPSKDKEYSLNDQADSSVFDAVINYIYFGNFSEYNLWEEMYKIVRIFKTIETLEIQDGRLLKYCKEKLLDDNYYYYSNAVSSQEMVQILNSAHGKTKHDDLYLLYLCKHMTTEWPHIYNVSLFCSISWTMLENMLKSDHFNLYSIDSHKILDICSKWLSDDLKNRYHFIPQIIKIINPLCVIDHDKFTTSAATKLNDYSEQWVQNELLHEMQSSLPYIAHSKKPAKNMSRKSEEIPVFIALKDDDIFYIYNVNMDEIVSLVLPGYIPYTQNERLRPLSAALMYDNLFIFRCFWPCLYFGVYNLPTKKYFKLNTDFRLKTSDRNPTTFTLLNCKNEIYCCSEEGLVMKYSIQMNRWMMIWKQRESKRERSRFTSDGKKLYRIYNVLGIDNTPVIIAEAYNFEKKLWNLIPHLPSIKDIGELQLRLTVINDRDLAVSTFRSVALSDRNSNRWIVHEIPDEIRNPKISIFTQFEDRMLLMVCDELYQFSPSNQTKHWELKKKLASNSYQGISAIHSPRLL